MKALVIVVSILNGPPNFSTSAQGFMGYEDCMFLKQTVEKGKPTQVEIKGAKVIAEHVTCQLMMQEDFDRLENSFRKN